MIYCYNKNQRDALFLKFILINNSTCFGQVYCPSSRVSTLYTQRKVFVIQVMLFASEMRTASNQRNLYDKYLLLFIQYLTPDDGQ